jgi:hypothetical protein
MNHKTSSLICLLILQFLVLSCKDDHEYNVPEDFAVYVKRFENEAAKRNKYFDLQNEGLIIEFADLDKNRAGLCHYEKPIRIEIDRTYWKALDGSAGADLMRENLLFHELGHGILNRKHLNTWLDNGDWKSIMCGGDAVDNRPWNINYRGFRRKYYIDELFNESTLAPDSLSPKLAVDTTGFARKLYLTFDTSKKEDTGWKVDTTDTYMINVDNKRLRFTSAIDKTYLILAETSMDFLSDFTYELSIECQSANASDQYGIIFGNSAGAVNDIEYFSINKNAKMYMGNKRCYSFYTELPISAIHSSGVNKLTIMQKKGMLYYYVNDVYVYCSESWLSGTGKQFGFLVPPRATVWLNDLKIKTPKTTMAAIRPLRVQEFKTLIKPLSGFGTILNREN